MLKINLFFELLVLAVLFVGCSATTEIPSGYLKNPREMETMTNGCWIYINQNVKNNGALTGEISGELIAAETDTFFILTRTALVSIPVNEIKNAKLMLFKDQTGKYVLATVLGLVPNVAGALINGEGAYLAMGIPFAIVGSITAVIEIPANKMVYPGKIQISDFHKFARFPQGRPVGIRLDELTLYNTK